MTKEEKIEQYLKEPVKVGEYVYVRGLGSKDENSFSHSTKVLRVNPDNSIVIIEHRTEKTIKVEDYEKVTYQIGCNPFKDRMESARSVNFELSSILFRLGLFDGRDEKYTVAGIKVQNCNFNPYIIDSNGEKQFYQRPLVWSEDDKRNLIDSIYYGIDCGKILIRKRDWNELEDQAKRGDTELFWNDVVDGKQRLNAIKDFLENKFKDSFGNFYRDLSDEAQRRLVSHQLFSYSEMPENSKDEHVKEQFLKLNFCGVPQSKEHIEFVKNIR